ncbi:MAG: hypothetical protein LBR48_00650, partial [Dysgonamonadaceae bacterium]|nr:hypothetical protein [Dysgonamonadaceae bacterium]
MKKYIISILCLVFGQCLFAQTSFRLQAGHPITVACDTSESQVVQTALELLNRDCEAVFSSHIV